MERWRRFRSSRFASCRFAGELYDVIFDASSPETFDLGNTLEGSDFRAAILRYVGFRNLSLRT